MATDKSKEAMKLALRVALENLNSTEPLGPTTEAVIDAAQKWYLAEQPAQQEPVAWRDHVEQRLRTWQQSFVNRSGDQLALDDFMDKRSLDDLIDFVCDEYTSPPAQRKPLTDEQIDKLPWGPHEGNPMTFAEGLRDFARAIEAAHGIKEKNT